MPLARTQSVLKRALPEPVFDWLYRVATAGYYAKQEIADWWYYNNPQNDCTMIRLIRSVLPYTMVGRGGLIATYKLARFAEAQDFKGCFVECGVAQGGCSALMMLASQSCKGRIEAKPLLRNQFPPLLSRRGGLRG